MMEENFWIQELQMQLKKMPDLCKNKNLLDCKLYLFGSACSKLSPNDIDIVLMYPYNLHRMQEIFQLRDEIIRYLEYKIKLQVHILTLSYEEEKQILFLSKENAKFII